MGVKCAYCGKDKGVTFYVGKTCQYCGKDLGFTMKEKEAKQ